jgi:hypothetical protein
MSVLLGVDPWKLPFLGQAVRQLALPMLEKQINRGNTERGARVTRILPWQVARQHGAFRKVSGHVLHGVDCDVNVTVQESCVNLLGEEALAPDVGERLVQDLIPCTSAA